MKTYQKLLGASCLALYLVAVGAVVAVNHRLKLKKMTLILL